MLKISDLSLTLGNAQILNGISFSLMPGQLTVLLGANGSGKSSLLGCVNQQHPYSGHIFAGDAELAARSPRERAKLVAILPQQLPAPHITAWEMAAFGRNPYLDLTGRLTGEDKRILSDALAAADALNLADRYVDTLSGGERQRVALAMILAQNAPIALLDEPTAHMDPRFEDSFLALLSRLAREQGKTILVVIHDINAAIRYADSLLILEKGRLVFSGSREACLAQKVLENTFSLNRHDTQDGRIFFAP